MRNKLVSRCLLAAATIGTAGIVSMTPAAAHGTPANPRGRQVEEVIQRIPRAMGELVRPKAGEAVVQGVRVRNGVGLKYVGSGVVGSTTDVGAVFGGVERSTDLVEQSLAAGRARQLVVLNDASAPTEHRFRVTAPTAVDLAVTPQGGVRVRDQRTGSDLTYVKAPWAQDAAGREVPTSYRLEGDEIVQVVQHLDSKFAYPIVADPQTDCGWFACTLYFNRGETQTIKDGLGAVGVLSGACAVSPISAAACVTMAAASTPYIEAASAAYNQGGCLAVEVIPGVANVPRYEFGAPFCT